ncbi:MAG: AbrB/MazE/SpoVT family DNA-binding domain-containing protein, partial [Oscillospiraceae bacterium]|nr:AbrB/MazE/SpoVT family DNA-binding domain-containing protein [Oscillospiraceae bacterium]
QIVIPARARKIFGIEPGDSLVILGDEGQGLAVIKSDDFIDLADAIRSLRK